MGAPLLIADVPWMMYRAYFGLPRSIAGDDGRPVNALLGTVNAMLSAIEARTPRAVVACTGAEQARYRVELYSPYHANRDPMPDELRAQWEQAPALLASFGWTVADAGELEADDAIGAYARVEARAGGRALLLTADRDLYQAVGERVAVLDLGKGQTLEVTESDVIGRYGVAPERVPDFIALRGDPSDGLPGAPGIGAKTAARLLQRYGTLEALLEQAERQGAGAGAGENAAGESTAGESAVGESETSESKAGESATGESAVGESETSESKAGESALRPRIAAVLRENAELLRTFKRVATLVEIDVERPPDRPTDFAGGAAAVGKLGMKRLAERLQSRA